MGCTAYCTYEEGRIRMSLIATNRLDPRLPEVFFHMLKARTKRTGDSCRSRNVDSPSISECYQTHSDRRVATLLRQNLLQAVVLQRFPLILHWVSYVFVMGNIGKWINAMTLSLPYCHSAATMSLTTFRYARTIYVPRSARIRRPFSVSFQHVEKNLREVRRVEICAMNDIRSRRSSFVSAP